ncbi:MAG TPA: excinuclease ABC subunit UvrC [Candidatus Megaira endosymbiont of Stentor roeselii]|nr:excinuclease ABC subunit UvrC [Candidatus Megaera endosymbiont of Stentor roeselii]
MTQYQKKLSNNILYGKELIKSRLEELPGQPGVYRMLDIDKKIIYIGKAKNLKNRLKQYTGDLEGKNSTMISLVYYLEYSVTDSESSALLLEGQLIKKFKPRFNILLKDDKSFPYIKLRLDHEFPQLIKYRGRDLKNGKFFGPFASVKQVEVTLLELQKIFKLRSCSDSYFSTRKRPCLQYQINRCSAPCTGKISKKDYDELVEQVKTFLSGKNKSLQNLLAQKMQSLSEELNFEEAAKIRDRIKALSYIQLKAETTGFIKDTDLIAITELNGEYCVQLYIYRAGQPCGNHPYFPEHTQGQNISEILEAFIMQLYQDKIPAENIILSHSINDPNLFAKALKELHGIKIKIEVSKKSGSTANLMQIALENARIALEQHLKNSAKNRYALEEVQKLFNLPALPNRIEVYDNSHIQGSFAIGAMIVAGKEGFDKKEYRLFTIKDQPQNIGRGDDYAMLREVLIRRLNRLKSEPYRLPDLMIIDGGTGHMNIAQQVLEKFSLNIPFVCMSKGIDRNSGREQFHRPNQEIFTLDKNLPVMKYLQILRDEAHNFAIKNHRKKRSKAIKISSLDNIPGIGEMRKKALLSYFGSFAAVADSTIDELTKVEGINKELAQIVYEALRK